MRNDRYVIRPRTAYRAILPIIVVVCDDTKTAVAYFNEMKRDFKSTVTLKIIPAPCTGATAEDVVQKAMEARASLQSDDDNGADEVWVLLDLESGEERQARANNAKQKAENEDIRVARSNPCFEIWILAHLVDTGRAFRGCEAVLDEVKQEWSKAFKSDFGAKKAQADYSKLMPLRADAIRRCKTRNPQNTPSWTEVYRVVESIMAK